MRKKLILFFCLCSIFTYSNSFIGKWSFDRIVPENLDNSQNLKPISSEDQMIINEDGTFRYEIANLDLIAYGTWSYDKKILTFNYLSPIDTIRNYEVSFTANRKLVLNENGINYSFLKSVFSIKSILRGFLGLFSLLIISFFFSRD